MSIFGKREPSPPRPEVADELRDAARALTGWTVRGTRGLDLESLLRRAADCIDDYARGAEAEGRAPHPSPGAVLVGDRRGQAGSGGDRSAVTRSGGDS